MIARFDKDFHKIERAAPCSRVTRRGAWRQGDLISARPSCKRKICVCRTVLHGVARSLAARHGYSAADKLSFAGRAPPWRTSSPDWRSRLG